MAIGNWETHAVVNTLSNPEHIFMLLDEELESFVADPQVILLFFKIDMKLVETLGLNPPVLSSRWNYPTINEWERNESEVEVTVSEGDVLAGTAGCSGVVTGRARIVRDPTSHQTWSQEISWSHH